MRTKIINYFKKSDPLLYSFCLKYHQDIEVLTRYESPFLSLCREIVSQQLASKAAQTIFNRFLEIFPKKEVTSQNLLNLSDQEIRDCGLSWTKVSYLKDLAQKVDNKELDLENLGKLKDEEVILELIKVKGIGRWTAEMFLIFYLGREDVFSHGDLGLRRAIEKIYKLDNPSHERVEEIALKWVPFRSYACRILWRSLDNKP